MNPFLPEFCFYLSLLLPLPSSTSKVSHHFLLPQVVKCALLFFLFRRVCWVSQLCQFYAWLSPLASNDCFTYTLQTAITVDCIYPSTHMFCWRSQLQCFDSIACPLERVLTLADNDRKWQLHQTRPKYVLELMPCLSFFFLFVCLFVWSTTDLRNQEIKSRTAR